MGKSYLLGTVFALSLLVPSFAFAGCEDGTAMSEDAALRDLGKTVPGAGRTCRTKATSMKNLPNGESHNVIFLGI